MVRRFTSSQHKSYLRCKIDLPLIRLECQKQRRPLRYFGLPSEGFYDVRDWSTYISDIVAVERGDRYNPERRQSLLLSNAINLGLIDRLTLLRGEINQVILSGVDVVGQKVDFPFELVNLDYGGALLYPDRARIEAFDMLITKQRGIDFILLLTLNTREFDSLETRTTQERIVAEIGQLSENHAAIAQELVRQANSYTSPMDEIARQVMHVLYMVRGFGEANRYTVCSESPSIYEGSRKTLLVHYAFRLSYDPVASTKVVSGQALIEILNPRVRVLIGSVRRTMNLLGCSLCRILKSHVSRGNT